jgi:hypothetical protein
MIHIYSIQYNKPSFIDLQKKSFDKFAGEYNFTVIDNSIDNNISSQIKDRCSLNNLKFIETKDKFDSINNGLHGFSHEIGINCFLNNLKNNHTINDIVILLDHDVFLISYISKIMDKIKESSILSVKQEREHVYYAWPGLTIFNLSNCININEISLDGCKLVDGNWILVDGARTDVGGHSYHYLKKYKNEVKFIDIMENFVENVDKINDNHVFYHFHDGSQWSGYSNEIWNNKFEQIKKIIE